MHLATPRALREPSLFSYGSMREARPRERLAATNVEMLADVLRRAEIDGRRVTLRGAGRSFDDQAINDDLLIDVAAMNRILDFDPAARQITVEPGASWGAIFDVTLEAGLTPHIVVTTPWATAGGTLSANCISRSSPRWGQTGDHVVSFELLTVGGELARCSRAREPELFRAVIGGFGYFGVVTKITFELLELGERIRVRTDIDRREGLGAYVAHLTEVSSQPESCDGVYSVFSLAQPQRGAVLRSTYTEEPVARTLFLHRPWSWYRPFGEILFASSTIGNAVCHASYRHVFGNGPFVDDLRGYTFCMEGNERMKALTQRFGVRMRSLQQSFVVPTAGLHAFLESSARLFREHDVYPSLLDALHRPADDFLLSSASGLAGFCVTFTFEGVTAGKFRRLEPCILALNDACLELGGRIHLVKNVYGTRSQLRAMYGHTAEGIARAKARVDPRHVLTNDFFTRVFG